MKISKIKNIDVLFENGELITIDKEAINNIDMSELIRDVQVVNGYITEQTTAKYIVLEFNNNLKNLAYLNDKHMFGSTNNGLLTLEKSLDIHLNIAKDVVHFNINSVSGETIKVNVPWSEKDYNVNKYMQFIEGYDTFTMIFDSSKN